MSEFSPSKLDRIDLVLCTPAVLCVLFGSHILTALIWGLFFSMVALGRLLLKVLPQPGRAIVVEPQPQAEFKLVAHAKMSLFQWNLLIKDRPRSEVIWEKIKEIYTLDESYVKFTVDSWVDHINWNNEFQTSGRRNKTDDPNEIYLYFYTAITQPKPVVPEVVLEGDDARWARLFADNPRAYWLDPKLWTWLPAQPGEHAKTTIVEYKDVMAEEFERAMVMAVMMEKGAQGHPGMTSAPGVSIPFGKAKTHANVIDYQRSHG